MSGWPYGAVLSLATGVSYPMYKTLSLLQERYDSEELSDTHATPVRPSQGHSIGKLSSRRISEQKVQWLSYWILFSLWHTFEYGWLASCMFYASSEPMHWFVAAIRIAVLLWLQASYTEGARYMYLLYLKPLAKICAPKKEAKED